MAMPKRIYVADDAADIEENGIKAFTAERLLGSEVDLGDYDKGDRMAVYELKGYARLRETTKRTLTAEK